MDFHWILRDSSKIKKNPKQTNHQQTHKTQSPNPSIRNPRGSLDLLEDNRGTTILCCWRATRKGCMLPEGFTTLMSTPVSIRSTLPSLSHFCHHEQYSGPSSSTNWDSRALQKQKSWRLYSPHSESCSSHILKPRALKHSLWASIKCPQFSSPFSMMLQNKVISKVQHQNVCLLLVKAA